MNRRDFLKAALAALGMPAALAAAVKEKPDAKFLTAARSDDDYLYAFGAGEVSAGRRALCWLDGPCRVSMFQCIATPRMDGCDSPWEMLVARSRNPRDVLINCLVNPRGGFRYVCGPNEEIILRKGERLFVYASSPVPLYVAASMFGIRT